MACIRHSAPGLVVLLARTGSSAVTKSRRMAKGLVFGGLAFAAAPVSAGVIVDVGANGLLPEIPLEIFEFTLNTQTRVPFAQDPNNHLGDSIDGFGVVLADVTLSLNPLAPAVGTRQLIDTNPANRGRSVEYETGDPLIAADEFGFRWDVEFVDIDPAPGRNFAPGLGNNPTASTGNTINHTGIGPVSLFGTLTCTVDTSLPNLGCIPVAGPTYFLGFALEIPHGVDINDDGVNDIVRTRNESIPFTFQPPATSEGFSYTFDQRPPNQPFRWVDDPVFLLPFVGTLDVGWDQTIPAGTTAVPEPSTLALLGVSLVSVIAIRRRFRAVKP